MKTLTYRIVALALLLVSNLCLAETVVIVSKDSSVDQLSEAEIRDIFLNKINTFNNGQRATPIDQAESSPARTEFITKILERNESQLRAYWSRLIFTGKGKAPRKVQDEEELVMMVADYPDLVGYVSGDAVNDSVKVVHRIR